MTGGSQRLGEMLRSTRESRGIDRARAERDTRIRERYLSALERGAYDELPGDVYARGFLRSYGRYLGLDPDGLVALYRLETRGSVGGGSSTPRRRQMTTPQPRAFVLKPGIVVAAVLTMLVGALIAYLGYQLVTFARIPELSVIEPAGDVRAHREASIVLRGTAAPNSRVSVSGLVENPSVMADASGAFSIRVELLPGSNLVTITALDPLTTRTSPPVTRIIEFIPGADAGESRSAVPHAARIGRTWQETQPST